MTKEREQEMVTNIDTFVWDGSYDNHEQVRPYMDGYLAVRDTLPYPYNDAFKGRIPGIAESAKEDTGIYMLQGLYRLDQEAIRLEEMIADGFAEIDTINGSEQRFDRVIVYSPGYYVGGSGVFRVYEDARVRATFEGDLYQLMPKGKKTHGLDLHDQRVFVKDSST